MADGSVEELKVTILLVLLFTMLVHDHLHSRLKSVFIFTENTISNLHSVKSKQVMFIYSSLIVSFYRKHGKEYFTMCVVSIPGQSQHAAMARM